jgi:hypothetical protein
LGVGEVVEDGGGGVAGGLKRGERGLDRAAVVVEDAREQPSS